MTFCDAALWGHVNATNYPYCGIYRELCKVLKYNVWCYPLFEYRNKLEV